MASPSRRRIAERAGRVLLWFDDLQSSGRPTISPPAPGAGADGDGDLGAQAEPDVVAMAGAGSAKTTGGAPQLDDDPVAVSARHLPART